MWKREAEEPEREELNPPLPPIMEEGVTSQSVPVASISWKGQGEQFLESPEENASLLTP